MDESVVTLSTLGHGAAVELVQAELDKVLRNITDPNTDARAKRKIVLEITLTPSDKRERAEVDVKVTSKLAGVKPASTTVYFGRQEGVLVAVESDPRQNGLFDQKRGNVVPLAGEG